MIKKKRSILLVMSVILCCFIALTACKSEKLSKPIGLSIDEINERLTWKAVVSANGYVVDANGKTFKTKTNSFSLSTLLPDTYIFKVKAVGGSGYMDSDWTTLSKSYIQEAPTDLILSLINSNSEYEVTRIGASVGVVTVPNTYKGKPVTSIGAGSFNKSDRLTGVIIGDNVKTIKRSAFSSCKNLESVTISSSVTKIEESAFNGCSSLKSIDIPDSVTELGINVFANCTSLESVTIGSGLTTLSEGTFLYCKALTEIEVGGNISTIGDKVFQKCDNLKKVVIGDSVTDIGKFAFNLCASLTDVQIGTGLITIQDYAFQECVALKSINIPDNVQNIYLGAFNKCAELIDVKIGTGLVTMSENVFASTKLWETSKSSDNVVYADNWVVGCKEDAKENLKTLTLKKDTFGICNYAFYGCKNLETINTSLSELTVIGNYSFIGCTKLRDISLPSTLKKIGTYAFHQSGIWNAVSDDATGNNAIVYADKWAVGSKDNQMSGSLTIAPNTVGIANYAFYGFKEITAVSIPSTVRTIGYAAFYECAKLESATIPDAVTEVQDYTFYGCEALKTVKIGSNVKSIGRSAFYLCYELEGVNAQDGLVIPDSVEIISDFAFYGTTTLEKLTIGSNVKYIGRSAFYSSYNILDVNIPDSVEFIGDYAFYNASAISRLTIGNGVKSIGRSAFYKIGVLESQNMLSEITIPDSVQTIGDYAFFNTISVKTITIGNGVKSIGRAAFKDCNNVTSLTIGDGVQTIGDYAFYGCGRDSGAIKTIMLPLGLKHIGNQAFQNCTSLTSIIMNSSLESTGSHIFYGCNDLTIYTDAEKDSQSWGIRWNSSNRPVIWECTLSEDKTYVESFVKSSSRISNPNAKNGFSAPYRQGFTFSGWSISVGGEVAYTLEDFVTAQNGRALYAIWVENT